MKTFNVIVSKFENGSPDLPAGAGFSCLSQPEIIPVFIRVYCETAEQVQELLDNPDRFPFVAALDEGESTPDNIKVPEDATVIKEPDGKIIIQPAIMADVKIPENRIWIKPIKIAEEPIDIKPIDVEPIDIKPSPVEEPIIKEVIDEPLIKPLIRGG